MPLSSQSNSHKRISPKQVLFGLLLTIGTLLHVQALSSNDVAQANTTTISNNTAPDDAPAEPIQAGLVFMPDYMEVGSAAVKNFGGYHYDCVTDSCYVAKDTTSAKALGGLTFKNCSQYSTTMGDSELLPVQVDVIVVHLTSYYYIEKLKAPIGNIIEWPPRVDVVGYNTTTTVHTSDASHYFQCPLSEPANLVRPWCFSCIHTANTTF
ncbi:hypothetical protein DFH28DRAFT_203219 [Melampsora americana]|nr:hypothetical protein DFH28DRAFT_203219 [Melampsora americana]